MAKLKLPALSEGGLLQRTLVYVAAFVLGSIGFVALASLIVVSIAKSVLPSHNTDRAESDSDKPAEVAAATPGKPGGKVTRPKRGKAAATAEAEEAPAEEAH